jgi:ClpP class serine protease
MNLSNLFWLFFIMATLQPWMKQRMLEGARQRLMGRIERQRGSRLILLVHRQETMSFLGFPLMRFIDLNDWEEVVRAIDLTDPDVPIDLVLHTPGGLVLASLQIARAINMHPGKVTVFVPHHAMSGGTLIALAADEIVMSHHAVLGPVDPQLGEAPAASILNAVSRKSPKDVEDETLILADQAEKAMAQVRASIKELLRRKCSEEKADSLAQILSEGRWTHDYPITAEAARELGLPVNTEMPKEIFQLMNLFPQPVRRQQSVEYLPRPRHLDGKKA